VNAPETPRRTTVSELARTLAERGQRASASVTVKVMSGGVVAPDITVTPDTTEEEIDRMTALALRSLSKIVLETAPKDAGEAEQRAYIRGVNDGKRSVQKVAAVGRAQRRPKGGEGA
jgi:intein-encoded DNA endonuclease-like protein